MDLLRLSPILAGFSVLTLTFFGATVQGLAVSPIARLAGTLIVVLALFGWPAMIVERLASRTTDRQRLILVRAAFLATLFFHAVLAPAFFFRGADPTATASPLVTLLSLLSGLLAPLYVSWSVARLVVSIEERQSVTWDRCVGTFLLFFFLPIGIFFLQGRVRRLHLVGGTA